MTDQKSRLAYYTQVEIGMWTVKGINSALVNVHGYGTFTSPPKLTESSKQEYSKMFSLCKNLVLTLSPLEPKLWEPKSVNIRVLFSKNGTVHMTGQRTGKIL
jgi:hypothetical protein